MERMRQNTPSWVTHILDELVSAIKKLPVREDVELRFVDYDDTIFKADRRYEVDPDLHKHRGDTAYPFIAQKYGTEGDEDGFARFVELLKPQEHLFDYKEFYDPEHSHHVILTAGNIKYQTRKIKASGFEDANQIIVESAKEKPIAMLEYILKLGYIPGSVVFIDDRIDNFAGIDKDLQDILGVPVIFYRAAPKEDNSVRLEKITPVHHRIQSSVDNLLAA